MTTSPTMVAPNVTGISIPPGTRLNGIYEIERVIGQGGMGMVYKGRAVETGDAVAIKVIRAEMAHNEAALALFRKEAAVLHTLLHEAIVRYYLFTRDPDIDRPYLATEFVDGIQLSDVIGRGALPRKDVLALAARLADGLQAAHKLSIVHRDISPDNVILPAGDVRRAKIIDFGIARASMIGGGTLIGDSIAGKFDYMSPEQLGLYGGEVTAVSDVYSLGIVLAEAALGRQLDMGGTQVQVVEKRRSVPDLSAIEPKLRGLIASMLAPKPDERLQTMTEVAEAARALGAAPAKTPSRPGTKRWAAAAVVLLVLGATGAYLGATMWPELGEEALPPPELQPVIAAAREEPADVEAATPALVAAPEETDIAAASDPPPVLEQDLSQDAPPAAAGGEAEALSSEAPARAEPGDVELGEAPAAESLEDGDARVADVAELSPPSPASPTEATGSVRAETRPDPALQAAPALDEGQPQAEPDAEGTAIATPSSDPAEEQVAADEADAGPSELAQALPPTEVEAEPDALASVEPAPKSGADDPAASTNEVTSADAGPVTASGAGSAAESLVPEAEEPAPETDTAAAPIAADDDADDAAAAASAEGVADQGEAEIAEADDGEFAVAAIDPDSPFAPAGEPEDGVARYVRQYDGGPCTLLNARDVGPQSASIEGYGSEVEPFQRFNSDFQESLGFEANIGVRLITDAQCPVIHFVRRLSPRRDDPLALQLDNDVIRSGTALTGAISGLQDRDMQLFVVSHEGQVYPLTSMTTRTQDSAALHTSIRGATGGEPQPHLVVALAGDSVPRPVDRPVPAAEFFPRLGEALRGEASANARLAYFMFGG